MRKVNLKKIKDEINKKKNNDQIIENERKSNLLYEFAIDRFLFTILLSLSLSLGFGFCVSLVYFIPVLNAFLIPMYILLPAIAGSSLMIGNIISKKLCDKGDIKKEISKFTKSHTRLELLNDAIYYNLESEKLKKRNKALKKSINYLESKESELNSIYDRFDFNNINIPQTEEQTKNKLSEMSSSLEQCYNKLDILSTKKFLIKYIVKISNIKILLVFFITLIILFSNLMPYFICKLPYSNIMLLLTGIWISRTTNKFFDNISRDIKVVLSNINNQLGDESLLVMDEKSLENLNVNIDKMLSQQFDEIKRAEFKLQEQKIILDMYAEEKNEKFNIEKGYLSKSIIESYDTKKDKNINNEISEFNSDEKGKKLILKK